MDLSYTKYKLKNYSLRLIIYKKKAIPQIFKILQKFYNRCYEKSIVSIGQGINDYNNLSEDDKSIIETILSLCY